MISSKQIKLCKEKLRPNRVKPRNPAGLYCTTHVANENFSMMVFIIIKIITNRFCVDRKEFESYIGYDMFIGRAMIVHLGLMANGMAQ